MRHKINSIMAYINIQIQICAEYWAMLSRSRLVCQEPGLAKSRSREICVYNSTIALKFDRHLGSSAADVPVKFQSDAII